MIDDIKLNKQLAEIVDLRNQLETLSYSDDDYDDIEDQLHEIEDDFNEEFADYLEGILEDVHEEVNTTADILLPTAYLSKSYEVSKDGADEITYYIGDEDGVYVKMESFLELNTRIVLVPNPARFYFTLNGEIKKELWRLA